MNIEKAAVIGSGVMGSGIAAHLANAGVPVTLLDIVPDGANNRNTLAEGAIQKLLKQDPAPLMHKRNAKLITPGNTEDDLGKLAEADWIVEVVIERLDIKHDVFRKIDEHRKPGSIVTSNTSTIPLAQPDGRDAGEPEAGLRHHPLLQPAALPAPAGAGRRPGDAAGGAGDAARLLRRAPRQGRRRRQGHARLHRQPHRHAVDAVRGQRHHRPRPDGRGGRPGRRQADGRAQDRHLRPDRPGRHRPDAPRGREHEGAAARPTIRMCRNTASRR